MLRVAVRRENGDLVAAVLQANSSIDDQPLSPTNAQIRVEKDNVLLILCHGTIYAADLSSGVVLRYLGAWAKW